MERQRNSWIRKCNENDCRAATPNADGYPSLRAHAYYRRIRAISPCVCRALCVWIFAIGILAAPAGATTLARMSLRSLTQASKAIVRARCLGSSSEWEAGEIWTVTRFQALETFKGAPPAQFTVRLIGGEVNGIESIVSEVPRFQPGEEVVLFLQPSHAGSYSVTAWSEGTFRVRRGRAGRAFVTQESAGEAVYDQATRQFRTEGIRKMPLEQFRQRLRALLSSTSGGSSRPGPAPETGARHR